MRLILAFRVFFRTLFSRAVAAQMRAALAGTAAAPVQLAAGRPARPAVHTPAAALETTDPEAAGALRLLALFQREGRLVDFLQEEIAGFGDAQIGAAVRAIHRDCRRVVSECFALEPVLAQAEGSPVALEEGFDPAAIRLTGRVPAAGPYRGHLRHHGWRAARVSLPAATPGAGAEVVLAPAEVEIGAEAGR